MGLLRRAKVVEVGDRAWYFRIDYELICGRSGMACRLTVSDFGFAHVAGYGPEGCELAVIWLGLHHAMGEPVALDFLPEEAIAQVAKWIRDWAFFALPLKLQADLMQRLPHKGSGSDRASVEYLAVDG